MYRVDQNFASFCIMASGDLIISSTSLSTCKETCRVHLLPCEVEHDGDAKIDAYFVSSVREEGASATLDESNKGIEGILGTLKLANRIV